MSMIRLHALLLKSQEQNTIVKVFVLKLLIINFILRFKCLKFYERG